MSGMGRSYARAARENALGIKREMGWKLYLPWNWGTWRLLRHILRETEWVAESR